MNKLLPILLIFLLSLCGCVHNRQYRQPPEATAKLPSSIYGPDSQHPYYLAFIEFDELGELWDRSELSAARQLILRARRDAVSADEQKERGCPNTPLKGPETNRPIRLVVFIHGWKNNASEKSGNVYGFGDALQAIHDLGCKTNDAMPVVGVYISWRGATINAPVLKEFTYWNRQDAAQRIPGAHLTATLAELVNSAKKVPKPRNPAETTDGNQANQSESVAVIIGHSFGGQLLERTISQPTVQSLENAEVDGLASPGNYCKVPSSSEKDYCLPEPNRRRKITSKEAGKEVVPPADLTVFLNEAAPATEGIQMLSFLKLTGFHYCRTKDSGGQEERPLFLSITSVGDTATNFALPLGQSAALAIDTFTVRKFRRYENIQTQCLPAGNDKQSAYYRKTTANTDVLQSHELKPCDDGQKNAVRANAYVPNLIGVCADVKPLAECGDDRLYCIQRKNAVWNDTAYWVMQVPEVFVPDHSTVFGSELQSLLAALVTKHQSSTGAKTTFTAQ